MYEESILDVDDVDAFGGVDGDGEVEGPLAVEILLAEQVDVSFVVEVRVGEIAEGEKESVVVALGTVVEDGVAALAAVVGHVADAHEAVQELEEDVDVRLVTTWARRV